MPGPGQMPGTQQQKRVSVAPETKPGFTLLNEDLVLVPEGPAAMVGCCSSQTLFLFPVRQKHQELWSLCGEEKKILGSDGAHL